MGCIRVEKPTHRTVVPGVRVLGAIAFGPEGAADDSDAVALLVELSGADVYVGAFGLCHRLWVEEPQNHCSVPVATTRWSQSGLIEFSPNLAQ